MDRRRVDRDGTGVWEGHHAPGACFVWRHHLGWTPLVGRNPRSSHCRSVNPLAPPRSAGDTRRIILAIDDDARVIDLYRRYAEPHGSAVHGITNNLHAAESAQLP